MKAGETWNESVELRDPATARPRRRLTQNGIYNTTPTYHYNTAFTADSRHIVFATAREGQSALLRADVETGDLTVLLASGGFGNYSLMQTQFPWAPGPHGAGGFTGTQTALVPASGWVVAGAPDGLHAVHVETGEARVLAEAAPEESFAVPAGNASGTKVYVPVRPTHPDFLAGRERPSRPYREAVLAEYGGLSCTMLEVDIESGGRRTVYQDDRAGSNHVLPSPVDDDLLLFDRDLPPTYAYYGDHCESPRAHLMRLSTGELTPLRPRNRHQFQSHTNWNRAGTRIYYHGPAWEGHEQPVREFGRVGEMFVGVSDLTGESVWERNLPEYHYGHVSTHTAAEAIVTDGLVSSHHITAIHYEELDGSGCPRIEILGRHDTDWNGMLGQPRDPHCHMSPDGKWLSCNVARAGRSDVHLIQLG